MERKVINRVFSGVYPIFSTLQQGFRESQDGKTILTPDGLVRIAKPGNVTLITGLAIKWEGDCV
jgi:hypothetical protein